MGNAHITPRDRHNLVSVADASSSQEDERASMTRTLTHSVQASASGHESTTQDETTRYLPKGLNPSNKNGVVMPVHMPSGPYGSGEPSKKVEGIESPQWGWYISITPPTEIYHSRSFRPALQKRQESSATASQVSSDTVACDTSTAPSRQPNRIFQEMVHNKREDASVGWSSVPL